MNLYHPVIVDRYRFFKYNKPSTCAVLGYYKYAGIVLHNLVFN